MRKLYIALCGGIILSGCSSFSERHQASGNFEYLNQTTEKQIKYPEGFTPLKHSTAYDIPAVSPKANQQLVGNKLDIRAPSLVMPVAPNALVSDSTGKTEVIFESFLSHDKFRDDLWNKLTTFITNQGYGVGSEQVGQSLTTRTIVSDEYFKVLFGLEEEVSLDQQYSFDINVEPQGHKATISVSLTQHQEQGANVELNQFAKRRYEARMLNHFLSQVYVEHNKQLLANRVKTNKGIKLELGLDNEQNTVYQIHAPYELAWEKLATVLPKLGLEVEDRDKSVNTYFTKFSPIKDGFWSNLFSEEDGVEAIKLEKNDKYQVKLVERGDIALLTIVDSKGERLSSDKMREMLAAFRELMAKKAL